jgi:hypothetical protein
LDILVRERSRVAGMNDRDERYRTTVVRYHSHTEPGFSTLGTAWVFHSSLVTSVTASTASESLR